MSIQLTFFLPKNNTPFCSWWGQKSALLLLAEHNHGTAAQAKGNAFCAKITLLGQTKITPDTSPSTGSSRQRRAPTPRPIQS